MNFPKPPVTNSNGVCQMVVVQDQLQVCPYLDGRTARMPLKMPVGTVTPDVTDWLLASGHRRSGDFVYTPQCPGCRECKPTRLEVAKFRWSTSLRRVLRRGDHELLSHWGPPGVDPRRVELFNLHRSGRQLGRGDEAVTQQSYEDFLVETCCQTKELSLSLDGELIGVSIVDIGQHSLSAVYTYFDPAASRYSLGTYAILKQIQWALENERRYLYLGLYVAANTHLNYKARFVPQQRFDQGHWHDIPLDS
jgi:leucyl-tRNA---protein transferase